MRTSLLRIIIATGLSFVFSLFYNGFIHLVILNSANKQIEPLRRVDFSQKMWISILATVATSFLFTVIYTLFVSKKNMKTGSHFGFIFGIFIAIIVDLNQYVLYPLPFSLVAKWACFGIIEFTIIGLIVSSVIKGRNTGSPQNISTGNENHS